MAEAETTEQYASRKMVAILVLIGTVIGGTVGNLGVIRVGGFSDKDAQLMESSIRGDMPPLPTRQKILHIEDFLAEKYQDFKPVRRGEW